MVGFQPVFMLEKFHNNNRATGTQPAMPLDCKEILHGTNIAFQASPGTRPENPQAIST